MTTTSSPRSTRCHIARRFASDEPFVTRTWPGLASRYIAAIFARSSGVPFPCEYASGWSRNRSVAFVSQQFPQRDGLDPAFGEIEIDSVFPSRLPSLHFERDEF